MAEDVAGGPDDRRVGVGSCGPDRARAPASGAGRAALTALARRRRVLVEKFASPDDSPPPEVSRVPPTASIRCPLLCAAAAFALAGCGAIAPATDVPPAPAAGVEDGASPEVPDAPDAGASPAAGGGDYPTCDQVYSALGPEASDLVIAADADNGEVEGSSGRELSCVWTTPQAAANSLDLQNYGGFGVGIHRDPSYLESDYDALGWTIDDPRLGAEGAWALTAGGHYDGGAVVDIGSVQVVRDGTIVTISATGAMLNEVPQLADLTQSWAVGAGLRILDLMR